MNSKVSPVVIFGLLQFYYNSTDSISSVHSHMYLKTHLQNNILKFYHIPNTIYNFKVTRFVLETIVLVIMVTGLLFL